MSIYHALTPDSTKELVEGSGPLKAFVRELNYKFNVVVMAHDVEHAKHMFNGKEITNVKGIRFMMTKPDTTPVMIAKLVDGATKEGGWAQGYSISAPFISKDRSGSSDRSTRESINMKGLLKAIEKDMSVNPSHATRFIADIFEETKRYIFNKHGARYSSGVRLSEDTLKQVLSHFMESMVINASADNEIRKAYETCKRDQEQNTVAREMYNRFKEVKCHLLVVQDQMPARAYEVMCTGTGKDEKIEIHGGVKCYTTIDELHADIPDLAISMKMFMTKNSESKKNKIDNDALFPIYNDVVSRNDVFDKDLDAVSGGGYIRCLGSFSNYSFFMTPVIQNAL